MQLLHHRFNCLEVPADDQSAYIIMPKFRTGTQGQHFRSFASIAHRENQQTHSCAPGFAVLPTSETDSDLISILIDNNDVPEGELYVGQLKNRTLPVAAALFTDNVARSLQEL